MDILEHEDKIGGRADDYVPFTFYRILKPRWWRRLDAWIDRSLHEATREEINKLISDSTNSE